VVLLALVVVGGAVGYAAARETGRAERAAGPPTPIEATDPAYPFTPPLEFAPDPDLPQPLNGPFATREAVLGTGPFGLTFPVPNGWERQELGLGEARWVLPGDPANTHSVRVELVASQTRTIARTIDLRVVDLRDATGISGLTVLDRTADSLTFSFVLNDHLRLSVIRWVSPRGTSVAEAEIAATGRMRDQEGLEDLVDLIANSIHP
jgi:hypothetical protein